MRISSSMNLVLLVSEKSLEPNGLVLTNMTFLALISLEITLRPTWFLTVAVKLKEVVSDKYFWWVVFMDR